ncbi:hypothetical protein PHLGIDRAFT_337404 [Phlebiopsis gigantea 11061_1 CR5-6]|uniref:Uncharacterized protein n=1 Tax=Phlebiopsis gigantea (strain 11061_1 CR5-6) TaxID=745531 RepID=A0A0C3RPZ3_PHLG1|nr:hypothetical protein PHLGIDRAFT_337404 [Phlebiopsis gigantea 11061_1 CR5-6]
MTTRTYAPSPVDLAQGEPSARARAAPPDSAHTPESPWSDTTTQCLENGRGCLLAYAGAPHLTGGKTCQVSAGLGPGVVPRLLRRGRSPVAASPRTGVVRRALAAPMRRAGRHARATRAQSRREALEAQAGRTTAPPRPGDVVCVLLHPAIVGVLKYVRLSPACAAGAGLRMGPLVRF